MWVGGHIQRPLALALRLLGEGGPALASMGSSAGCSWWTGTGVASARIVVTLATLAGKSQLVGCSSALVSALPSPLC
jgi:hypothetical protein